MSKIFDKLVDAVKEHSGMTDDEVAEAGRQGADAGFPGFTYFKDTIKFYNDYEKEIWAVLVEQADQMGEDVLKFISSFRTKVNSLDEFKNLLAWYALEEAGRYLEES
jgi:hypothetical protein